MICAEKMTKNSRREKVKARKCLIKRFEEVYPFLGAGRFFELNVFPSHLQ